MVFLFDVMVTCLFWELLPWATLSVTTLVQRIVQNLSTIYSIPTGSGFPNTHTHTHFPNLEISWEAPSDPYMAHLASIQSLKGK